MIGKIINVLPDISDQHARSCKIYAILEEIAGKTIKESQLTLTDGGIQIGDFGHLIFPYHNMGAIDTLDLFGLDELILFSFYWVNRYRYKKSADIGANLGLHSLLMSRCGWQVSAYEPDPVHVNLLRRNLNLNRITNVQVYEDAISEKPGTLEFVRVLGNTTGSHLAGAKLNPYGQLERFPVNVLPIDKVMANADFIKLDAEGQEKIIILATNAKQWESTDMVLEVGSVENAQAIFEHLNSIGVCCFSQKHGWDKVTSLSGMPTSHKEGSLFISTKLEMPWTE
jgi:FkbM family methyltransferase